MNIKNTKIWKFFSSIKLAIWLLGIIACVSVIGTLIPQGKQTSEYIAKYGHSTYHILENIGLTNLYSTGWFLLLLALLALNLAICLANRFTLKMRSLGTLISHLSILVILSGALVGMLCGEKGYIRIYEGQIINSFTSRSFKNKKHEKVSLNFSLRLDDFIYEEYGALEEKLAIYSRDGKLLAEIHPEVGKKYRISESGYAVKVLRYVPDFIMDISTKKVKSRSNKPNNPAIEIKVIGKKAEKTFWIFGKHTSAHKKIDENFEFVYNWARGMPKDFISKVAIIKDGKEILRKDIYVNKPLKFGGYTFFQSSYDTKSHKWSGLQIAKDPGVPIVYSGFILLILGLCIRFYINPLIKNVP